MKKISSVLLTLVLALGLSINVFAATDAETKITASGDTVYAEAGETATLTFTVSSDSGKFSSYELTLQSQSDKITITDNEDVSITYNKDNGKGAWADANNTDKHVFTVKVKVAEDILPGNYDVDVVLTKCTAKNGTEYSNLVAGTGTIVIECKHTEGCTWVEVEPTSCKKEGLEKEVCGYCGEDTGNTRPIAKLPHTPSEEWYSDGENHWHKCTVCGEKLDSAKHTAGTEWASDKDSHWHVCTVCGEVIDSSKHAFEWIVDKKPTEKEAGLKHEECSICKYKRNVGTEIPASGELDDVPQTNDITLQTTIYALSIVVILSAIVYVFRRKVVK